MESFFVNWYTFWKEKRALFFSLLLGFFLLGAWSVFNLKLLPIFNLDYTILTGFLVIPLVGVLLFFRKTKWVFLSFLPSLFGGVFTLIIYYLIDNEIGKEDWLSGAVVSGLIFTYTLHLFSNLRKTSSIVETISVVFKPILVASLITSFCFFLLISTDSDLLKKIGLFGGINLIGGLIGLLLVLPIFISRNIEFKKEIKDSTLSLFSIKNKFIRFFLVTLLFGATIWLSYEAIGVDIKNIKLFKSTSFVYYGFGIVFTLLLVIYGRIEYALITFLPTLMTWIWTLGISALIGLELNEYIVFVFSLVIGLTIGSTILLSDSYKMIYSYGNKNNSGPISIFMVGSIVVSTIMILLVSDDSMVKSLAIFTLIGSVCFFLFSFFIQSYLIQLLIVNRAKRKKTPLTLFGLFVSIFAFSYFFLGCVILFFIHLLFRIIPFKQKQLKNAFRWLLAKFSWSMLYTMMNTKKRKYDFEHLDFSEPRVIIANHQSFLDILLMISLDRRVVIMTNEWVYKSPVFGIIIRYAGYLRAAKGIDANLDLIKERVADGLSVMIFPEGTRSESGEIKRFHKGAFYLAEKIGLPIQPILIQGDSYTMTKGDYLLKNGYMNLKALPKIEANDQSFGEGYRERTKLISKYFKEEHKKFDWDVSDSDYQFDRVIHNYVLKNPIMEWYIRIKWKFESKNYDFYNEFLGPKDTIYDLGCGYGYMSYYFLFRGPNRRVIGMDYDAEKISVADNCYDKTENISFDSDDLRSYELKEPADAIFLTDVVHYLKEEEQFDVLRKCVNALKKGGILFLRDGISDLQERHEKTKLTEVFSTKILGFNKSENQLHFFSKQDIFDFAAENGLTCEMKEQSQKTSNVLFILRK